MKNKKSFTLIELLVVIAIISLLASIIFVNLKEPRERARIVSVLEFSSSIHHILGVDAVGVWRFEDSGGIAYDNSGYGNHGTIYGATFEEGIVGSALQFNGLSDYVDCGNDESLDITDKITIEAWIKPASAQEICGLSPGNSGIVAKAESGIPGNVWSWQMRYGASNDSCRLGFQFNEEGVGSVWVTVKEDLRVGKWYHVVGTFDGADIKCYLNGELKDTNQISAIASSDAKLLIGDEGWGNNFGGIIDEVKIYNKSLIVSEIQKHYAEGLERYKNLAIK